MEAIQSAIELSHSKRGRALESKSPTKAQKPSRKKKLKESKSLCDESPTTIIQTDVANFRLLVQELTSGVKQNKPGVCMPSPCDDASEVASPEKNLSKSYPQPIRVSPPSKKPPPVPKTNQRLRNLAPPPISATAPSAIGFRPFVSRKDGPQGPAESGSHVANEQCATTPNKSFAEQFKDTPHFLSGLSPVVFSPHWLSPLAMASPKDLCWAAQADSPGSMAMRELAMKAMASGGQDGVPISPSLALPSPQLYPLLQGGFGIAFPVMGVSPHVAFSLGSLTSTQPPRSQGNPDNSPEDS